MVLSRRGARKWRAKIRGRRSGKTALRSAGKAKRVLMRAKKRLFKRTMAKAKRAMAPPKIVALRTSNIVPPRKMVSMEYRGCFDCSRDRLYWPCCCIDERFEVQVQFDLRSVWRGNCSFNVSSFPLQAVPAMVQLLQGYPLVPVFTLRQALLCKKK